MKKLLFALPLFFISCDSIILGEDWWLYLVAAVLLAILVPFRLKDYKKKEEMNNTLEQKKKEEMDNILEQKKEKEEKNNAFALEFDVKYGKCAKTIVSDLIFPEEIKDTLVDAPIRIYNEAKVIILQNRPYSFNDIISYKTEKACVPIYIPWLVQNNPNTVTTDMGSMVGRSLAGGLIAGPFGAAVGAMTSKRNINIEPSDSGFRNLPYSIIYINVRDLENPIVKYSVHEEKAVEIIGVLNIIKDM